MADSHLDPPTRTRFVLVAWLCGLSAILYLDRICWSQAADPIQKEFDLSYKQLSYISMAFSLAYGLFEIPTGRLGDRFGSRSTLVRIVVWWSVFTAMTGAAAGFVSLVAIRFLFGAGEAGAFPNAARVVARWFPLGERGRVQGLMLGSAQLGAVAAPAGAAVLIVLFGWRWTFLVYGSVGIVWAVGFWWWFRDDPADHPGVNAGELSIIRAAGPPIPLQHRRIPWAAVFANRGILALSGVMICGSFYTYFFYTWFPKYLIAARGYDNLESGTIASMVQVGAATGMIVGGWLADRIPRWSADVVRLRRHLCAACYLNAAGCLYLGIHSDGGTALTVLCGASIGIMHVTLPNWWSVAIPQAGRHVGALFGLMNGVGVVGAMSSQYFAGAFADWQAERGLNGREQWDPMFDVYVGVLILGAMAWWSYRYRPLEPDEGVTVAGGGPSPHAATVQQS